MLSLTLVAPSAASAPRVIRASAGRGTAGGGSAQPGGCGARWGTRPCVLGHPSHGQPRPSLPCAHVPGTCLVAVCVASQTVTFLAEAGSCCGDGERKENVERFQPTSTSRRGSGICGRRANGKETCSALRAALCLGRDSGFCLLFSVVVCLPVLTYSCLVGPSRTEPMGLVLFYSEIATDVSPYLWVSQPKEQRPRGMAGTQGAGRTWGWGRGCVPGVPSAERGPWGLLLTHFSEISQKDTTSSAFSCLSRMLGTSLGGKPSTERPGHRAPSPHADALRGFLPAPDAAKQPKSVHPLKFGAVINFPHSKPRRACNYKQR